MIIDHREIDAGDELRLHAAMSGSGPALLMLHGFTGSWETWAPFRERLARSRRVVALDLPGHGRSSSPLDPRRYSLRRVADDIARALDQVAIGETALLGYSMGGRAAMHFAVAHPDRVTALIIESSSPGIADAATREERERSDEELARFIEQEGVRVFVDRWERLPLWESQKTLPESAREDLREQRLRNNPAGLANSLRGAGAAMDPLSPGELARITAPALILAGEKDSKYVAVSRELARVLPDARTHIIAGAGHAAHLEQPDEFAAETLAFLENL